MSVDRARKDAAEAREWAQLLDNQGGIRDPRSAAILTGLAEDVDVLVSEFEAAQKAVRAGKEALDWLHVEALNGVICTPPPHEGDDDWGDFGGYNVEADTGRNYCTSCKSGWRKVVKARDLAAAVSATPTPTKENNEKGTA